MKVGLFIPCYVDQFFPGAAIATLEILEKLGLEVDYPSGQTCCGQPMANSGYERYGKETARHFVNLFKDYDAVVAPSGSCIYHVRKHFDIVEQSAEVQHVRNASYELGEFLVKFGLADQLRASFPYKVGLHQSCHGQRGLRLASSSEKVESPYSIHRQLLEQVQGLELVELDRKDECCGFGGTFAVVEEAVSVQMGKDRLQDHLSHGAEVLTGADMSCLMHLEGLVRRNKLPLRVMHFAEILNQGG
jgi:L-lactate dehydrogenase complex protein LldE